MRSCGSCNLCCRVLPVRDLKKGREHWCEHAGVGCCKIYEQRPLSCRAWSCTWLKNENIPDYMRPRESGVIIDPTPERVGIGDDRTGDVKTYMCAVFWVDLKRPRSWQKRDVWEFIMMFLEENHVPGLLRIGLQQVILMPPWETGMREWSRLDKPVDRKELPPEEDNAFT